MNRPMAACLKRMQRSSSGMMAQGGIPFQPIRASLLTGGNPLKPSNFHSPAVRYIGTVNPPWRIRVLAHERSIRLSELHQKRVWRKRSRGAETICTVPRGEVVRAGARHEALGRPLRELDSVPPPPAVQQAPLSR